ncbi:MAG: YdcF family protein [Sandaracinaceae bacterium]|nr:YdcF family protein [Sandaracinaceae bacterium]
MRAYLVLALLLAACASPADVTGDAGGPADSGIERDAGTDANLPDLGPRDASAVGANAVSLCEVDNMENLYSGFVPTNPYAAPVPSTECMRAEHDAIMVLGCPNNEDGSPADCQTERADIAVALSTAGFGSNFIVSGAAVHNSYVEAQTLHDLLVDRGVSDANIYIENRAQHTDENIYYSTLIMEEHDWQNALVVSEDAGHLIMSAVCDSNCCVSLGRLTVAGFPVELGGSSTTKAIAHYVRYPYADTVSAGECTQIERPSKLMCTNLDSRHACAGRLML